MSSKISSTNIALIALVVVVLMLSFLAWRWHSKLEDLQSKYATLEQNMSSVQANLEHTNELILEWQVTRDSIAAKTDTRKSEIKRTINKTEPTKTWGETPIPAEVLNAWRGGESK